MTAQTKKIFILTAIALLFYKLTKGRKTMSTKFIKFKADEAAKLQALEQALVNNGIEQPILNFALAQILLETGRFTRRSAVATLNNNYTGIKFLNKSYQDAQRGSAAPPAEQDKANPNSPLNFYAKFRDMNAWAKDYKRILSFGAKPINSTNIEDFAARLKRNGYYGSSQVTYEKLLKSFLAMFN
jgi:hypothetical protein